MKRCSRITVKGKVQGVSYRSYVQKQAEILEIEGTIQNATDGTVIVNACGPSEKFDDFIDILYKGSPKSSVEAVIEEPLPLRDFRGVFRVI